MSWKRYFWFQEGQKRGFVLLFFFLVLIFGGEHVWKSYSRSSFYERDTSLLVLMDSIVPLLEEVKPRLGPSHVGREWSLHSFNPNVERSRELKEMGFDSFEIVNIEHFRLAGGQFREREDFLKLYAISKAEYLKIYSFLHFDFSDKKGGERRSCMDPIVVKPIGGLKEQQGLLVDLNSADSIELQKVRGIGPVLAKRIVKFRYLLGGFFSSEQLKEVYGLRGEWVEIIKNQVRVNKGMIQRKDLNRSSFKILVRHPYLNYEQAGKILKIRQQVGPLKNFELLLRDSVFKEADTVRLSYYWFF